MKYQLSDWIYDTIHPLMDDIRSLLDDITHEDDYDDRNAIKWKIYDKLGDISNYLE